MGHQSDLLAVVDESRTRGVLLWPRVSPVFPPKHSSAADRRSDENGSATFHSQT